MFLMTLLAVLIIVLAQLGTIGSFFGAQGQGGLLAVEFNKNQETHIIV